MKKNRRLLTGALCLAAIALVLTAGAAPALEEDKRVVKKIRIHCEDGDCEDGEHHSISWFSGDGPGRFAFGAHLGGGFLGIGLTELTPELRAHFGVGEDEGVMISKVLDDSAAQRAGLEVGDIVTAVDGERIGSGHGLARTIRGKEDGETVLLEVWRDGSVQNLSASVEEREGLHGMEHGFVLDCEGEECEPHMSMVLPHAIDCEEGPCRVQVECDGGDCVCTVDGEETDCGELHGSRH